MSRRFQFSLRALLVAMLVVAAFFGGMAAQRRLSVTQGTPERGFMVVHDPAEMMKTPDGSQWLRVDVEDDLGEIPPPSSDGQEPTDDRSDTLDE